MKDQYLSKINTYHHYNDIEIKPYNKNLYIRTLNFEGQAAVDSYVIIANSNIRLLGS